MLYFPIQQLSLIDQGKLVQICMNFNLACGFTIHLTMGKPGSLGDKHFQFQVLWTHVCNFWAQEDIFKHLLNQSWKGLNSKCTCLSLLNTILRQFKYFFFAYFHTANLLEPKIYIYLVPKSYSEAAHENDLLHWFGITFNVLKEDLQFSMWQIVL